MTKEEAKTINAKLHKLSYGELLLVQAFLDKLDKEKEQKNG